jgi:putative Holliday junction resolvase
MRFLGVDHGARRIGLAYGDDIGVATPLPAISSEEPSKQWAGLAAVSEGQAHHRGRCRPPDQHGRILRTEGAGGRGVCAQDPVRVWPSGAPGRREADELRGRVHDSRRAKRRAVRKTGLIDSMAATIILQDYLDGRLGEGGAIGAAP